MLTYEQMVYAAPKDKDIMWKSIKAISCYFDKLWDTNPKEARRFLFSQWELMIGPHYNGDLSRDEVKRMMHLDASGKPVIGELVTIEEASSRIPAEKRELLMWDAYVGYNGFMHDLAHTNMAKADILKAADSFWFHDDDFKDKDNKVWWYYKNI